MWINDPKTKTPSVTLTFCVVSGLVALVGAIFEFLGMGKPPEAAVEIFWGSLTAYVGRKFVFKGKSYDSEESSKTKKE